MSSLQSTSDSQKSLNKEITSKVYQKKIKCVFLNQFDPKDIKPYFKLESLLTQIEVSVDVSVFGTDGLDTDSLTEAILQKLNEKFPGIEAIDLYLYELIYNNVFNKESSSVITKINNPIPTKIANFNLLSSVYVVITNIYGAEDFTTIQKVKCNFINPEGQEDIITLLLPEFPVPKKKFEQAFLEFVRESEVDVEFQSKTNKALTPVDCVTTSIIKENYLVCKYRSLSDVFDKFITTNGDIKSIELLQNYLFGDKTIEPVSPFSSPVLIGKVYSFASNKIYCDRIIEKSFYDKYLIPYSGRQVQFVLSGRTGCGKTDFITQIAKQVPVIYLDFQFQNLFLDKLKATFPIWSRNPGDPIYPKLSIVEWVKIRDDTTNTIQKFISCYSIAVILYFMLRFESTPSFFEIFLEQINGSSKLLQDTALSIYETEFDLTKLSAILSKIVVAFKNKIKENFDEVDIFFAADEAHLINPQVSNIILGYSKDFDPMLNNSENNSTQKVNTSELYPVTYALQVALHRTGFSSILAGVKVLFCRLEQQSSQSACIFEKDIFHFDTCKDPYKFLSKYIKNVDKTFDNYKDKLSSLAGRYRDSANIIVYLLNAIRGNEPINHQSIVKEKFGSILEDACSFASHYKHQFASELNVELSYDLVKNLLTTKEIQVHINFIEKDLFSLLNCSSYNENEHLLTLNLDEPISENCLKDWFNENFLKKYKLLLDSEPVKNNGSCRGTILEDLLLNQLFFIGTTIQPCLSGLSIFTDLVAEDKICIPRWMKNFKFKINKLTKNNTKNDDRLFFSNYEQNVGNLLSPSQFLGPDGVLFLNSEKHNSFLLILIGCKFSGNRVSSTKKKENKMSTDISNNSLLKECTRLLPNFQVIRILFEIDLKDSFNVFPSFEKQNVNHIVYKLDKFAFINLFKYKKTKYLQDLLSQNLCSTDETKVSVRRFHKTLLLKANVGPKEEAYNLNPRNLRKRKRSKESLNQNPKKTKNAKLQSSK